MTRLHTRRAVTVGLGSLAALTLLPLLAEARPVERTVLLVAAVPAAVLLGYLAGYAAAPPDRRDDLDVPAPPAHARGRTRPTPPRPPAHRSLAPRPPAPRPTGATRASDDPRRPVPGDQHHDRPGTRAG